MYLLSLFSIILTSTALSETENSCEIYSRKCFRIIALIPARAGSKGIKNKNLSRIGNETLLTRSLRIIKESDKFESVWVSTDGKTIADEAFTMKAKIHWRDPKTASDNSSTVAVVKDFLLSHKGYDYIAVIQCTSPFIQKEFISEAIDTLEKTNPDCLFSVTKSYKLRWTENSDGFASPLNFNAKKRPRRQDWNGELVENGMFYFVKEKLVLQKNVLQNDRCKTYEIPEKYSLEIDSLHDLVMARIMAPLLDPNY